MSHRMLKLSMALTVATLALTACGRAATTGVAPQLRSSESRPVVSAKSHPALASNEFVVTTQGAKAPELAGAKAEDSFTFAGTTYTLMSASSPSLVQRVMSAARTMAGIKRAEPNPATYALGAGALPDDEFFPLQFGLQQKEVPDLWAQSKGDPNMIVAVVDTGVDYTHPDLEGRVVQGKDFSFRAGMLFNRKDKDGPMDDNGHGTHCAGIIGAIANNGLGIAGVAPGVKLLAVKVLGGKGGGTSYDVMKGVAYAITNGAKIVNMSLGGSATTSVERQFYEAAVQSGALIVAAAGNDGDALGFPASYPGVLSVGATDSNGELARFSNHDAMMSVTAPGVGILSTLPGKSYGKLSGTSMAAPFVSGAAALVWSAHPDWTAQQVKDAIERTATDRGAAGVDPIYGHGEINIKAAVAAR